jgi:uncharacterized protein YndB with AHSA1/START domain
MSAAIRNVRARAVADFATGEILATVEIAASPDRVFKAVASEEIVDWWAGEGMHEFRTTDWKGDVHAGATGALRVMSKRATARSIPLF